MEIIRDLSDKIVEFHEIAWNLSSRKIFEKYSGYCVIVCKICNWLYAVCGVFTILNPIAVKLSTGNLVLPYGFKLPFIDEFSFFGYLINLLHHLTQDFLVVFGFMTSDGLYAIIVIHVYCVFDVLIQSLDELHEAINKKTKNEETLEIRRKLKSIVKLHQQLLRLVK